MILYAGNILSIHGNTPTFIETLAPKLNQIVTTVAVSDKKSKVMRMADMVGTFLWYQRRIRLVFIDTYSTSNFWYCVVLALLSRLFGKPYVCILRGGNLPSLLKRKPTISGLVFSRAARLVSPSEFLLEAFKQHGYSPIYIPNFVNIADYRFKLRSRGGFNLCWVRAYQNIYNPLLALRIIKQLRERGYPATLVMIGPDKGMLEQVKSEIIKHGISEHVFLHEKLSKAEWTDLAASCDVLINTTNFDNRPVTLLEAMAIGLPIISTNAGGIPDLLENGKFGELVPIEDVDAFVARIINLANSPHEVRRLSEAARTKSELFSWENVWPQWKDLIYELVQPAS